MDMLVLGGRVCWPSDDDFRDFKKDATRQERADRDRNVPVLLATVGQQLKQAQADRQELSSLKSSITQQQEQYQQQQQQYQQLLSLHEQVQESATVLTARLAAAQAAGAADALLLKQMIPALVLECAAVLSAEPTLSGEQQQQQSAEQALHSSTARGQKQAAEEGLALDDAARFTSSGNGSIKLPMIRTPGQSEKGTGLSASAAATAASQIPTDALPVLAPTAAATVVKGGHRASQSWGACTAAVASILSGLAADEPGSPTGAAAAAAQPLAAAVAAAASSPVTPAAAAAAAADIASATAALKGVLLTMPTCGNGNSSPFHSGSLVGHLQGCVAATEGAADAVPDILAAGAVAAKTGCICCSRCSSTGQAVEAVYLPSTTAGTALAAQPVPAPQTAAVAAVPRAGQTDTVVLGTAAKCCQDLLLQILRTSSFRRTGCTCSTTSSAACSANSTPFGTLRGCKRPCLTASTVDLMGAVTESCEKAEAMLALSSPTTGAAAAISPLGDAEAACEQQQKQQKQPSLEQQVALTLLGCAGTDTAPVAESAPTAAPAPAAAVVETDAAYLLEVGSEPQSAAASAVWAVDSEASAGARSLGGGSEVLGDEDELAPAVAVAVPAAAEGVNVASQPVVSGWTRAMYDELLAPSTCENSSSNNSSPGTANTDTTMSDPFASEEGADSPGLSQSAEHSVLWAVILKGYITYSNPLAEPDDLCDWPVRQPCISSSSFGRGCPSVGGGSSSSGCSGSSSSGQAHHVHDAQVGHLLNLEEVEMEVAMTALNKQVEALTRRITQQLQLEAHASGSCMQSTGSSSSSCGRGSAASSSSSSSGSQQGLLAEVLPLLREVNAVLQHSRQLQ